MLKNGSILKKSAAGYQSTSMSCSRGFTLAEVLLVVGIIALALGAGTLSLAGFRRATSLESELKSIGSFVRTAQERSLNQEEQSRWGVFLENPTGEGDDYYALYKIDEALYGSGSYSGAPGTITDRRNVRAGIKFVSPPEASSTNIIFNKLNGIPERGASVRLTYTSGDAPSSTSVIVIQPNGVILYPDPQ